jgi:hypothetical protein
MTHSFKMPARVLRTTFSLVPLLLWICFFEAARGQTGGEDFKVYNDHPRLLLTAQRLRLLRRERERKSSRWQQFEILMKGNVQMPEPGFANALFYQVSGDESAAKQAITWAMGGSDLRQLALVFDWCQPVLTDAQKKGIAAKLRNGIGTGGAPAESVAVARSRAFAVIALADYGGFESSEALDKIVSVWWRRQVAPALKSGARSFSAAEMYPLYELLHAVRDNSAVDLREEAPLYFRNLPTYELLSYYPATYPAAENDFHIPAFSGKTEPDLNLATLTRAAELSMVSYDSNATDSQFLQGWLLHDRFLLRGPFGIPYEFLWANPYQPGLSYFHVPLRAHDPRTGRFFLRSSWDEDATWLGYFNRQVQIFEDGKIRQVSLQAQKGPLVVGDSAVMAGTPNMSFTLDPASPSAYFILGLKPNQAYCIEVDDEELTEQKTDAGGILALVFTRKDKRGIRIVPASP